MEPAKQENAEPDRFVWLDSLRLAAGVSMVGLHATSDAQGQPFAQYETAERIAPMLLRAVIYTTRTELFLIISVFLLLMALEKRPENLSHDHADTIPPALGAVLCSGPCFMPFTT